VDDHSLEVSVSDRGPGVPPDMLDKIFEPFVRVQQPDGASRGTGLGLAITRRAMARHGARAEAALREGGLVVKLRFLLAAARRSQGMSVQGAVTSAPTAFPPEKSSEVKTIEAACTRGRHGAPRTQDFLTGSAKATRPPGT
jgi:hypothetical protein